MSGPIIGSGNEIWNVGYVFGTIQGGIVDDVPFGEMQDFQLQDNLALREVMGASSLGAVAVGASGRTVTGTCKWLKVRARQYLLARGGTVTNGGGITTYAAGINDEPKPFNMHFKTPNDGSTAELKVYGCVAPNVTTPLSQRDFSLPDMSWNCYGNNTNFIEFLLPGNQTTS